MNLAPYIEHTLLKPTAEPSQIALICEQAVEHQFFGVCVNGCHLPLAKDVLQGSQVALVSVIGFPLGVATTNTKAAEATDAVCNGADEIDMVLNLGWFKAGDLSRVILDIATVKEAIGSKVLKVILETHLLNNHEKMLAAECVVEAGADFVKTSTGFGGGGATLEDIKLLAAAVKSHARIKASGGIKTAKFANHLIEAGAHRLGTSSGILLVNRG